LKLEFLRVRGELLPKFRDRAVAAPLKPRQSREPIDKRREIPRPGGRGPIEATSSRSKRRQWTKFRDRAGRGPIEANPTTRCGCHGG